VSHVDLDGYISNHFTHELSIEPASSRSLMHRRVKKPSHLSIDARRRARKQE
jgi:uncharacterized protein YcaQ